MAIQSQFMAFLQDIEPSSITKANACTAHTNLRKFLRDTELLLVQNELAESVGRDGLPPAVAKAGRNAGTPWSLQPSILLLL
ncbi:MAG: hypothetical protein FJ276_05835 [Planctomycetes bacterium]|nr:hypothetical protein [Planctomycetota bacterium]